MEPEIPAANNLNQEVEAEIQVEGGQNKVESSGEDEEEDSMDAAPPEVRTRSGRASKIPSRYTD